MSSASFYSTILTRDTAVNPISRNFQHTLEEIFLRLILTICEESLRLWTRLCQMPDTLDRKRSSLKWMDWRMNPTYAMCLSFEFCKFTHVNNNNHWQANYGVSLCIVSKADWKLGWRWKNVHPSIWMVSSGFEEWNCAYISVGILCTFFRKFSSLEHKT